MGGHFIHYYYFFVIFLLLPSGMDIQWLGVVVDISPDPVLLQR